MWSRHGSGDHVGLAALGVRRDPLTGAWQPPHLAEAQGGELSCAGYKTTRNEHEHRRQVPTGWS
jgi:hypothetical protein